MINLLKLAKGLSTTVQHYNSYYQSTDALYLKLEKARKECLKSIWTAGLTQLFTPSKADETLAKKG